MKEHFGDLTISTGKSRSFLGMNFTIHNNKIEIEMKDYIREAIESFEEINGVVTGQVTSPAALHLFTTGEERSSLLDHTKKDFIKLPLNLMTYDAWTS